MIIQRLKTRIRSFYDDTSGNISIEFVLAMPILFWSFMAVYVYFDGYRQSAVNLKAAYTVSDLLSRETEAINDEYIDSMVNLLTFLTRAESNVDLRVTVIRWNENDDRYYVDWSANRGFLSDLTDANISEIEPRLPVMPHAERVILVETTNKFVPLFNVGMDDISLDNFVFTRLRFSPLLNWDGA